ncbi:hypothetical protein PENSPDRAFT_337128 [Peniophora sp. CONT]|nr:hypothetical protein PENSPDRAFT_337128 [Peniophora sp. CONT]
MPDDALSASYPGLSQVARIRRWVRSEHAADALCGRILSIIVHSKHATEEKLRTSPAARSRFRPRARERWLRKVQGWRGWRLRKRTGWSMTRRRERLVRRTGTTARLGLARSAGKRSRTQRGESFGLDRRRHVCSIHTLLSV